MQATEVHSVELGWALFCLDIYDLIMMARVYLAVGPTIV